MELPSPLVSVEHRLARPFHPIAESAGAGRWARLCPAWRGRRRPPVLSCQACRGLLTLTGPAALRDGCLVSVYTYGTLSTCQPLWTEGGFTYTLKVDKAPQRVGSPPGRAGAAPAVGREWGARPQLPCQPLRGSRPSRKCSWTGEIRCSEGCPSRGRLSVPLLSGRFSVLFRAGPGVTARGPTAWVCALAGGSRLW